jgi:hypothetical protein
MRLFFLTIPKPLKQHLIKKKIIHSADIQKFRIKTPQGLNYFGYVPTYV